MEPVSFQCAYYYTKQQIKNLRIRVCLQQLTGSQLVDVSPRVMEGTSASGYGEISLSSFGIPLTTFSKTSSGNSSNKQQQVISWQQKILSANEIVEYSRQVYADSPKYKDWYEQAVKLKKRKHWRKRIFTYINDDDYQSKVRATPTMSDLPEPETLLRRRGTVNARRSSSDDHNNESCEAADDSRRVLKDEKPKSVGRPQYFFIMADLAPPESLGETKAYEVVLCALRLYANGLLTVAPDFSKSNTKPYRLESFGSDNALYEYTLGNVSHERSAEDKKKEDQIAFQISHQRLEEIQQKVGSNWDEEHPEEGDIRLIVNGEITKAHHFSEAKRLYVHYMLHLPDGWKVNKGCVCEGFTPTCSTSYRDDVPTVHYSTPFMIDVTRSKTAPQGWPVLLLAAFSVDWWDRDRDEGFASFLLPMPGQKKTETKLKRDVEDVHSVLTWKPSQTSPFSVMRRYFLGGCHLLTDSSYLVISDNAERQQTSRLGFSTVSSGVVELHTNILIQAFNCTTDSLNLNGMHSSGWQLSTQAVLDAFHRSRQKLRAAKHGLI